MEHPDEGQIHTWLDGQLGDADAAAFESHVASCAHCRAAVAEARGFVAAASRVVASLDDVPSGVIPKSEQRTAPSPRPAIPVNTKRAWWSRPQLAAAALVFVMAGGLVVRGLGVGEDVAVRELSQRDVSEAASPLMDGAAPAPRVAGPSVQRELAENATAASERVAGKVAAGTATAGDFALTAPAAPPPPLVTSQRAAMPVSAPATLSAIGSAAGGMARSAERRAVAEAPAPAPAPAAPAAAQDARLQAKSFAAAAVTVLPGCYSLSHSPANVVARRRDMPMRVQLVDSASTVITGWRVARDPDNRSAQLAWTTSGSLSFVLRRIGATDTTSMEVNVGNATAPDGTVAVRGGC